MSQLTLKPIAHVEGEVRLPGSKSLSNRALLLAGLASGTTRLENLLVGDDVRHMLDALRALGVSLDLSTDGRECAVTGAAGPFPAARADLFLGNAGTAMRSLAAALCLGTGVYELRGEPRMHDRPIGDLVDALRQAGARIDYTGVEGFPPLVAHASGLPGGRVRVKGNLSSQYLTALLLAAPLARGEVVIEVDGELASKPYIDITLAVMARFGARVDRDGYRSFRVPGGQSYRSPGVFLVEGDASAASYFLAAAAIRGGAVRVYGVGEDSVQGDAGYADVLAEQGATVRRGADWIEVRRGELRGIDMDMNHIPDAAMTAAVTALFADGPTVIRNIYNWRVKETDRLRAMATELRKLGAEVREGEDSIEISPPRSIQSAAIDTYNDHRMAMSFALAALGDAAITINDPGCVSKTFPDYFDSLRAVTGGVDARR